MYKKTEDKRPDPKPRKHPQLWQSYLWWNEITNMQTKHLLRISSIEAGKSNMDAQFEIDMLEAMQLKQMQKHVEKIMTYCGKEICCWDWLVGIHGIGAPTAAKILAQIDDIALFDNISKLWRFAGLAVIDGKAEKNQKGEKSHFNRQLKSEIWVAAGCIIKAQKSQYLDIYYEEKSRLRSVHPESITVDGKTKYNDAHINNMAIRKMEKLLLSHLWLIWREGEGLPVSEPYAIAHMPTHTHYIEPYAIEHSLAR